MLPKRLSTMPAEVARPPATRWNGRQRSVAADLDRLRTAEEAARQASQRREALEARRQEMEPRRARLSGRLCELREALADRTRRRGQLELAARASAVEQAEHALGAPNDPFGYAHPRGEADSALAGAQQAEQNARSQSQQLEAESKALAELAGPSRMAASSSTWSMSRTEPLRRSPLRSATISSAAWTMLRRPTGARGRPRPPRLTICRPAASRWPGSSRRRRP